VAGWVLQQEFTLLRTCKRPSSYLDKSTAWMCPLGPGWAS
jgi:hypothetical protein